MARGFMYVYERILKETRGGGDTDKSQERDERKR